MYHAEMLLSGVHDSITITLQADDIPASDLDTCVYLETAAALTHATISPLTMQSLPRLPRLSSHFLFDPFPSLRPPSVVRYIRGGAKLLRFPAWQARCCSSGGSQYHRQCRPGGVRDSARQRARHVAHSSKSERSGTKLVKGAVTRWKPGRSVAGPSAFTAVKQA